MSTQPHSELARLRSEIAPALERAQRGEGSPLDADQIKTELARQLAQRKITD